MERAVATERRIAVTSPGIIAYGLAGNWCEECGHAKMDRLLMSAPSGCKTCDEAITRHRCTGRPPLDDLAVSESWTCPDCDSVWTCTEKEDTCGECGQVTGTIKAWETVAGVRVDTAPRYEPYVPVPIRNTLRRALDLLAPRGWEKPSLGTCYRMGNGSMVHVKPGCRCPR